MADTLQNVLRDVPKALAFVAILVVGWLVARAVRSLLERLSTAVEGLFDNKTQKSAEAFGAQEQFTREHLLELRANQRIRRWVLRPPLGSHDFARQSTPVAHRKDLVQ